MKLRRNGGHSKKERDGQKIGNSVRLSGKESTCQCRRWRRLGFDPWVRKTPWSWKWQLTPVFLPGKSHGQEEPGWLHRVEHLLATNQQGLTQTFKSLELPQKIFVMPQEQQELNPSWVACSRFSPYQLMKAWWKPLLKAGLMHFVLPIEDLGPFVSFNLCIYILLP